MPVAVFVSNDNKGPVQFFTESGLYMKAFCTHVPLTDLRFKVETVDFSASHFPFLEKLLMQQRIDISRQDFFPLCGSETQLFNMFNRLIVAHVIRIVCADHNVVCPEIIYQELKCRCPMRDRVIIEVT